jgi:hypothetical protein
VPEPEVEGVEGKNTVNLSVNLRRFSFQDFGRQFSSSRPVHGVRICFIRKLFCRPDHTLLLLCFEAPSFAERIHIPKSLLPSERDPMSSNASGSTPITNANTARLHQQLRFRTDKSPWRADEVSVCLHRLSSSPSSGRHLLVKEQNALHSSQSGSVSSWPGAA